MKYRQAMDSTLDVLTFLAYAAVLGLCIGALLGGLALVLSAPAHAAGDAAAKLMLRQAGGEAAAAPPTSRAARGTARTRRPRRRPGRCR